MTLSLQNALNSGSNFNIAEWFPNHTEDKTRPALDKDHKVVEALKSAGVNDFAATGYCFGGILLIPDSIWIMKNINLDSYD